jgi:hypothetical protein
MTDPKPVHESIALDRAWQIGRRIYVRCGYESTLGAQLREIGANWDREQKRLWVGSGKKARLIPLVQAADERVRRIEEIKREGRWVRIPYHAQDIREAAKSRRGIWDPARQEWAFATHEDYVAVRDLVVALARREQQAIEAERRERARQRQAARAAEAAAEAQAAVDQRARVLAASGRTPTGEEAEHRVISTRRMNKATAWDSAHPLGKVVRLRDGRRGVVVERKVWFTGADMASSVCWHPQTHDEAHWDLLHVLAIVEPTADERAADEAEAAERADTAELHQLAREMQSRSDHAQLTEGWSEIPDSLQVGVVRCWYGTADRHDGGRLLLTRDDRVVFQHPGFYDEWVRTERITTDPELLARVRAVFDAGGRTRRYVDQMNYDYEVVVHGDAP